MFLKKGETEWGRTVPLPPVEEDEDEEPDPYPSSRGGTEGITALDTTKKKLHTISHISEKKIRYPKNRYPKNIYLALHLRSAQP